MITAKARSTNGLFTIHHVEDKWYFEIPDSIFGREISAIPRIAKTATGAGYGGEEANEQVLRFEKGPENKIFLRVAFFVNIASDTLLIYQAVKKSNVEPIAAVFDVKARGKDSTGTVIEVTIRKCGHPDLCCLHFAARSVSPFPYCQPDCRLRSGSSDPGDEYLHGPFAQKSLPEEDDKWAIEWGYKVIAGQGEKTEMATPNEWVKSHASDPRYRFLRQRAISSDPRAQTEDFGDNSMKANEYGIKNLKRVLPNLTG